jgi:DMSO/TMAO reductase YedYZ heme-binding membrane subunit
MIGVILILVTLLVLGILSNSLNVLVVSGIITVISYKYQDLFKKATMFYIIALVIVGVSVVFYKESWTYLVTKGIIGYGFIVVVMFVGVLPNKWTVSRNIKINRGLYSILGFILISPHALLRVFGVLGSVNLFGIAAYVIMIPLTMVSFRIIRDEIESKDWLNIQKAAYVIYGVLFVHLILVAGYPDKIVYAVILTLYVNNKLIKEFRK